MGYDSTMQYNVGVQDKLLQDEGNSLFVHPGYTKCSLSQQSLSDLTPTQSTKHFGNVVKFLIPSMADLLGPVDLMLELNKAVDKSDDAGTHDDTYVGWVESLGYAMIDYASLHIGQNEIERISGDQMQLMNELMTSDKAKQIKNVAKVQHPHTPHIDTPAQMHMHSHTHMCALTHKHRFVYDFI